MVAARFVVVRDDDVNAFSEQQQNENTKKKVLCMYDLKIFRGFLRTCDEKREIEDIMPVELQANQKICACCSKKKNGDEHEPLSIREVSTTIFEK